MYKSKIIRIADGASLAATLKSINAAIMDEAIQLEFSDYGKVARAHFIGYRRGCFLYELALYPAASEGPSAMPYWKVRYPDG
jgi:hypothetical protein